MHRIAIALIFLLGLFSFSAKAQCTKDTDCKGNRVCENGKCVESKVPLQAPAPAFAPSLQVNPKALEQSSVRGAAYTGFVLAAVTMALVLGAEFTKENQIPSLPLGGVATATVAISVPLIAYSGSSLRFATGVEGIPGVRIAGWLAYAGALVDAAVLIGLGVAKITPEDGLVTSAGVIGATSMVLFSIENLKTYKQAQQKLEGKPGALSLSLPMLSPVMTPEQGATGASFVLAGRF